MNAAAIKTPTFTKLREDGLYDYGYIIRISGKRDRLEVVGICAEFAAAQRAALALPAQAA